MCVKSFIVYTRIGACPPCGEQVVQSCVCGKEVQDQPCEQPRWSCEKVCGKLFPCGQHLCQRVSYACLWGYAIHVMHAVSAAVFPLGPT